MTRVLFINENIGGHATVHHHLRTVLATRDDVDATFLDVPAPSVVRRAVGASIPGLGALDLDLQPLRAQLALSAWVRRHAAPLIDAADVVHLYTQNAGLLSSDLLRSRPSIVTLDTTNANNAYRLPYRAPTRFTPHALRATLPFERRVYDAVDAIVANSGWVASSLLDDYGIEPAKIDVIPFGVVGPASVPLRPERRPRIVFVGRQLERKGGLLLLDVFREHLADRAELLLITHDPVPPTPGVTVVDDLHQGSDRLWDLLADADVFAFPSAIDQAPNAVLEAMASGLPVVAARTAAVPEMVVDGQTGRIFEPHDGDGLRMALEHLVDDPHARRSMGDAGRRRFETTYEAHTAVERLLGVIGRVVSGADRVVR